MKRFAHIRLVVALFIGLVGVGCADPRFASDLGLDFWNYSKADEELQESLRVHSRLDESHEQMRQRAEFRASLVDDLLERRMTAEQALQQFQELNQSSELSPELLRVLYRTDDARRIACLQLVRHLDSRAYSNARFCPIRDEAECLLRSEFPD